MSVHGERQTATDNQGRVYEWINGQWFAQGESVSAVEAALVGAGDTFEQLKLGAQQLVGGSGVDINQEVTGILQQEQPLATGIGQALPFLATAPLSGGTLPGLAGVAGVDAALGGLMPGTPSERAQNALLAGGSVFAGGAVFNAVNRVRKGIQDSSNALRVRRAQGVEVEGGDQILPGSVGAQQVGFIGQPGKPSTYRALLNRAGETVSGRGLDDPSTQQMVRLGNKMGVTFEPGVQVGGRIQELINVGAKGSLSWGDLYEDLIHAPNQRLMQTKLLKAFGSDAEVWDSRSLGNIRGSLIDERQAILDVHPNMAVDAELRGGLEQVKTDYNKNVSRLGKDDPIIKQVDNVLEELKDKTVIPTKDYTRMREQLRGAHRKAIQNDPNQAFSLQEVIDQLDAQFARSSDPATAERFNLNTQRFRLLKTVEGPGVVQPNSSISFPSLRRQLGKKFNSEFTFDNAEAFGTSPEMKEVFDTVKVLSHFKDMIGDSGTAARLSLREFFSNPISNSAQLAARPIVRGLIESSQPTAQSLGLFPNVQ